MIKFAAKHPTQCETSQGNNAMLTAYLTLSPGYEQSIFHSFFSLSVSFSRSFFPGLSLSISISISSSLSLYLYLSPILSLSVHHFYLISQFAIHNLHANSLSQVAFHIVWQTFLK